MLLTHSSGFANFGFLEPDGRLRIHFEPGTHVQDTRVAIASSPGPGIDASPA